MINPWRNTMNEIERASMQSVVVDKAKLVETLKVNREAHKAAYDEALVGYRAEAVKQLAEWIGKIDAGKVEQVNVHLPAPEDHTADYDTALAKLEWSLLDTVELSARDFETYVQDNWAWKAEFLRTNAGYTERG